MSSLVGHSTSAAGKIAFLLLRTNWLRVQDPSADTRPKDNTTAHTPAKTLSNKLDVVGRHWPYSGGTIGIFSKPSAPILLEGEMRKPNIIIWLAVHRHVREEKLRALWRCQCRMLGIFEKVHGIKVFRLIRCGLSLSSSLGATTHTSK